MDDSLIESLQRAVDAAPTDAALRLHLGQLLVNAGRGSEAVGHAATVLAQDPSSVAARDLMSTALGGGAATSPGVQAAPENVTEAETEPATKGTFDWSLAEEDLGEVVPPMFADSDPTESEVSAYDVEETRLTLKDVGGMEDVKKRLNAAFLAPMRNEELRTMYKKSLRGGLLLYGPPGCGKTFIARALAGELGIKFLAVSMADILDMWLGNSEKNMHELFQTARENAPCVLFLDELDAIGHKRSGMVSNTMRGTVNQLLLEMDGVQSSNEGVFVLGATNAPWDVDPALRRPGRLDRTMLVTPPDEKARESIWQLHLSERPIANVDVRRLAKMTPGYSGADIAHLCDAAAETALLEAAETGHARMISQADVERAIGSVRPSVLPWFETAKNVAMFGNNDGAYDELATYLRKNRKGLGLS
jgi:SpoVK/Ycf46/Vps4 family AAA+-type ATPase